MHRKGGCNQERLEAIMREEPKGDANGKECAREHAKTKKACPVRRGRGGIEGRGSIHAEKGRRGCRGGERGESSASAGARVRANLGA
eukprot:2485864-Pleurochrysis_carterae.AAC.1